MLKYIKCGGGIRGFLLSANFGHSSTHNVQWGGTGWIIEPEEGNVLALTSPKQPFVTLEIDISASEQAKQTYPRYVPD
jgi:N-carbamoylputrescine amidase